MSQLSRSAAGEKFPIERFVICAALKAIEVLRAHEASENRLICRWGFDGMLFYRLGASCNLFALSCQ